MNNNLNMREHLVKEYLTKVDFSRDWSYNKILQDLHSMLGEKPGLDVVYKKDVMINEVSGTSKEIKKIDKVVVVFSDMSNENFRKVEFLID